MQKKQKTKLTIENYNGNTYIYSGAVHDKLLTKK